ncbi:MAG: recombination-associated protein RdgC [Rhodoferax sp.]|nr:recombination-associated protein RdgC [Rhodoferax sp.]
MFKNLMVYRLAAPWTLSQAQLEAALQQAHFVECGASQEKSVGWTEPRGQAHGACVEVVAGQWIMKWMLEAKTVPGSVVKRKVQEEVHKIEAMTGRKPGKKEIRTLGDDARLALLPMAFTKQASVTLWLDPQAQLLVLDAGSQAKADEVLTSLVKAVDGLVLGLINTQTAPATAMAHWLGTQEAPTGFSVDRECELKAADESKAVVRYTRHALDTGEVVQHIANGKVPTRLAMTWKDRVSFVLTEALQLKKVAFLDVVADKAHTAAGDRSDDHFDADVAIATGELSRLLPQLLDALGGEITFA